jgi:hypothetical protein
MRGSLLFSALINIGHGWEYQATEDLGLNQYASYYHQYRWFSYSDYPQENQDMSYFIYSIVYFAINFGFFFILNTTIEVKIVHRMQQEMRDKRERITKLNCRRSLSMAAVAGSAEAAVTHLLQSDEEKKKEEEDLRREKRVIKMVLINGIINFLLRAPDMLFWLANHNIWSGLLETKAVDVIDSYSPGLLGLIFDVGYLTFILTFTTNFFIFYFFNTKFKEAVVFVSFKPENQKI